MLASVNEWSKLLSPRERAVALLIAGGLSNKDIARELGVSLGTVKVHVHNIFQKLGVKAARASSFTLGQEAVFPLCDSCSLGGLADYRRVALAANPLQYARTPRFPPPWSIKAEAYLIDQASARSYSSHSPSSLDTNS